MALYTLGVDIGSTTSKCIILEDGRKIAAKALVPSGTGTAGPSTAIAEVVRAAGLNDRDIAYTVSTGYGRRRLALADTDMSELSCHAKGAQFIFPGARTVIDIGGQDIKVLSIEDGMMTGFQMNDKCAAGTGRFLEVMARVLGVTVDELGELAQQSTKTVQISSTCTVFAESEVISQLSNGAAVPDIVAGIHRSVASKVVGLVHRVGLRKPVVMTGGVSRNTDVIRALQEQLECPIATHPLSQYAGALGAAMFGYQRATR